VFDLLIFVLIERERVMVHTSTYSEYLGRRKPRRTSSKPTSGLLSALFSKCRSRQCTQVIEFVLYSLRMPGDPTTQSNQSKTLATMEKLNNELLKGGEEESVNETVMWS
jgi:hypothetical protein